MSAIDFCEVCLGGGGMFKTVTQEVPGLSPAMQKRISEGRPAYLWIECPGCDGTDHVTGLLETEAEAREEA